MSSVSSPGRAARGPWFTERPRAVLVVAAVLFVAIFALRVVVGDVEDVISMLYALPVSLLAVAFGARAGTAAGGVAVSLVIGWVAVDQVGLSTLGWVARSVPLLLLGYLLGNAADRLRRVESERRELETAVQRHRDAAEINDTIVQGMTSAKWMLELGRPDEGLRRLSETIGVSQRLVSELLRDADLTPSGRRTADPRFSAASNDASRP